MSRAKGRLDQKDGIDDLEIDRTGAGARTRRRMVIGEEIDVFKAGDKIGVLKRQDPLLRWRRELDRLFGNTGIAGTGLQTSR